MTVAPESYEPLDFSTCGLEVESHISGAHMSPRQSTHSTSSRHTGYPVDRVSGQQRVRHMAVHALTSGAGLLYCSGPWQTRSWLPVQPLRCWSEPLIAFKKHKPAPCSAIEAVT